MVDYNLQYYAELYDMKGILHRVELLLLEYSGGATAIQHYDGSGPNPIQLKHLGSDVDSWDTSVIQGQELIFDFYVTQAEVAAFDSLFESDYRDYKVRYYINSQLEFEGWVKPENLNKEFLKSPPNVHISLSATDGLAELKEIDYRDSTGKLINGVTSQLQSIKNAVALTGIELDFYIQLNTYETTYMYSDECALEKILINNARFYEITDQVVGIKHGDPMKAWDVIESILKLHNCKFLQYKGRYQITNRHELDSYYFVYDYTTLAEASAIPTDNIVNISAYDVFPEVNQQKVRPLKKVDITFKNKDLGGDVSGLDLSDWSTVWVKDFLSWSQADGIVDLISDNSSGYSDSITLTSDFSVTKVTESDYIRISFDHKLLSIAYSDKKPIVKMLVQIKTPDGVWHTAVQSSCSTSWQHYASEVNPSFLVLETGLYNIKISFTSNVAAQWDAATFQIKNVKITKPVNALEETNYENVTYDNRIVQTSNKGYDTLELETILGDGSQITEAGTFLFDNLGTDVITSSWCRYGETETLLLLDVFAHNVLDNRYGFKNTLSMTIIDRDHTLGLNTIVTIDGRYYEFLSFNKNGILGEIEAELIELLPTKQTYNGVSVLQLDNVNGETLRTMNVTLNGTSSIPDVFLRNTGDTGLGEYRFNTDTLFIHDIVDVVGINTTSVAAALVVNAADGNCLRLIYNDADSGPANYADLNVTSDGYLSISSSGGRIDLGNDDLVTTGNVGIGFSSTPIAHFEVQSDSSTDIIAAFGSTTSVNASYPAFIYISNVNTINSGYNVNDNTGMYLNYVGYQNGITQFRDLYICDGKTNVLMSVDGSVGNIGIGINSPLFKLDVEGASTDSFKFGVTIPIYLINNSPNIGFNAYYNSGWKYGKGSSSHFGGAISFNHSTGNFTFNTSGTSGNAGGAITMQPKIDILSDGGVMSYGYIGVYGSSAGSLSFQAAESGDTCNYIWPGDFGSNAEVLTTDGNGNLSWEPKIDSKTLHTIHGATVTGNTIFDALSIYIPNTNDTIMVNGSIDIASPSQYYPLLICSYALRYSSTVITFYGLGYDSYDGTIYPWTTNATDASSSTYNSISISWMG